jgi:outer membrane protein assembly factor BamA
MKRAFFLLLTAVVFLSASLPAAAQTFLPKTIQFKGVPEYSDQELLAAADLKVGVEIPYSEMKAHAQKLLDTGLFDSSSYSFNGTDLIFTIVPSSALCTVRLENLPLAPGKELDAALHERVPLYHGKVPSEGALTEQVRQALQEMLAAKGIKAIVAATPFIDPVSNEVTQISFAVTAPPVQLGEIHLDSASASLDPAAQEILAILAKLTGSAYNMKGSPSQIEASLSNYYRDKGYLEAAVHATAQNAPVITPESVRIPFLVSVSPGALYKLAGIQLAPGLLITQADFDRQSHIHSGDVASLQYVRENWKFLERYYRGKGYMEASILPTAHFDRAQATVSYAVKVEPGSVYTMGKLTIENGADDLRAAMLSAWKMPSGAVFNEDAIRNYCVGDANTALGRTLASAKCKYNLTLNDDTHTVDVALRLEKKR